MGLLQKAVETFDSHLDYASQNHTDSALMAPVGHIVTRADLEITLDQDGRFVDASAVDKSEPKIVIPATEDVYLQCITEGLTRIFVEAGCAVSTPTCGPCLGGHMGCMCEGERAVATTNRNFVGRMGHVKSEVILASPAVAAASAIKGCVASPTELD